MEQPTHDTTLSSAPAPESTAETGTAFPGEREILRALLRAGRPVEEGSGHAFAWKSLAFDAEQLHGELLALLPEVQRTPELRERLSRLCVELAAHQRLQVARVDDLELPVAGREFKVPRLLLGEALGPLGADLFPTRRRAQRICTEAARELVYFGYGKLSDQILPSPVERVREVLGGEAPQEPEPVLLEEDGPQGRRSWTVLDLLAQDRWFQRKVHSRSELARLQQRLREDPLDGSMVTRLREFFSHRLTIGLRDTLRWALGSRHPWFDWRRARELLDSCFEHWGAESFLSPRRSLYTWDAELDDVLLAELLEQNRKATELLAERLRETLPPQFGLSRDDLFRLAAAALDFHCDHPDFDLEATGRQQGETSLRFAGRAALSLAKSLAGWEPEPRRNVNFAAHFESAGLGGAWLERLDPRQKTLLFQTLRRQVRHFVAQSGGKDGQGRTPGYHRPPFALYTFFEAPSPRPAPGEKVLDSYRLSELRAPLHTVSLRQHPDVVGKLVVFFTLVLRHSLDTDHVPDLRPENLIRDFMLLGIWGYDTSNVVVNLYEHENGSVRSEVRFFGRTQFKRYRAEEDRFQEAALARKAVSTLGPLLEPSMLRALGNFLMAAEENHRGLRAREASRVSVARHALEVFRETARQGLRASLVDLATALEVAVDDGVDSAQRLLDRVEESLPGKDGQEG